MTVNSIDLNSCASHAEEQLTSHASQISCHASDNENDFWTNPVDHFRPTLKFLTVYFDRQYVVDRWLHTKERWLKPWYMPWWSPVYQMLTWYSQRNRNVFLVENNLNYRPYAFRRNDEDRDNPYETKQQQQQQKQQQQIISLI